MKRRPCQLARPPPHQEIELGHYRRPPLSFLPPSSVVMSGRDCLVPPTSSQGGWNGGEGACRHAGALREHLPKGCLVAFAGPDGGGAAAPDRLRDVGSAARRVFQVRELSLTPLLA